MNVSRVSDCEYIFKIEERYLSPTQAERAALHAQDREIGVQT